MSGRCVWLSEAMHRGHESGSGERTTKFVRVDDQRTVPFPYEVFELEGAERVDATTLPFSRLPPPIEIELDDDGPYASYVVDYGPQDHTVPFAPFEPDELEPELVELVELVELEEIEDPEPAVADVVAAEPSWITAGVNLVAFEPVGNVPVPDTSGRSRMIEAVLLFSAFVLGVALAMHAL